MFWRIGFVTAWRNREQSLLAILSIAMAAAFMTNAMTYSRGYTMGLDTQYRALIGGEISAYSVSLSMSTQNENDLWQYQEPYDLQNTDLAWMMPELTRDGYVSSGGVASFDQETIAAIEKNLTIQGVYPRYQMPALSCGDFGVWSTPLRGRNLQLDALQSTPLSGYISQGRWFTEADEGAMVAIVNTQQHYPVGQHTSYVGQKIVLSVPNIIETSGTNRYDFCNPNIIELEVIGVWDARSRYAVYIAGAEYKTSIPIVSDEIFLPLTTWQTIWKKVGGGEYHPQQLSLLVSENSFLEDIVLDLRIAFPEHSFYSVPQLVSRMENSFTMENPERPLIDTRLAEYLRPSIITKTAKTGQAVLVQDLRLPLTILLFINAAFVVASHLLIIATGRAKEVGILKAVGATRRNIVQSVLGEALLISLTGAISGYLFLSIPTILNQMTNKVTLLNIIAGFLRELGVTLAVACLCTAVFAMIPAMRMTNYSVREILQGEST